MTKEKDHTGRTRSDEPPKPIRESWKDIVGSDYGPPTKTDRGAKLEGDPTLDPPPRPKKD